MRKRSRPSKPREPARLPVGDSQRRESRMARGRIRIVAIVRKKLTIERKMPDSLLPHPNVY